MSDQRFLRNVQESRDNGWELVCSECGCGMSDVDFDYPEAHESDCANRGRDRAAEAAAFLASRLGGDAMTWVVEAAHGCGTWIRHFDTPTAARVWGQGMVGHGYETTVTERPDGDRHLRVINGGRGEGVSSAAPAAEGHGN